MDDSFRNEIIKFFKENTDDNADVRFIAKIDRSASRGKIVMLLETYELIHDLKIEDFEYRDNSKTLWECLVQVKARILECMENIERLDKIIGDENE